MKDHTLKQLMPEEIVFLDQPGIRSKEDLFNFVAGELEKHGRISDAQAYIQSLHERESTGSTYIGNYIAIPHGKCGAVKQASAAFLRCPPFTYQSYDEHGEVSIVMMLAIPDEKTDEEYLELLSQISCLLLNDRFFEALQNENSYEAILAVGEQEMGKPLV